MYTTEEQIKLITIIEDVVRLIQCKKKGGKYPPGNFSSELKKELSVLISSSKDDFVELLSDLISIYNTNMEITHINAYVELWIKYKNVNSSFYLLDLLKLSLYFMFEVKNKEQFRFELDALSPLAIKRNPSFKLLFDKLVY